MATGRAIIVDDADYSANPLGMVNVNPPTGLPSGCTEFYLTAGSRLCAGFNRITGASDTTALVGTPVFSIDGMASSGPANGLRYPDKAGVYGADGLGFTVMAVTVKPASGAEQRHVVGTLDFSPPGTGWSLNVTATTFIVRMASATGALGINQNIGITTIPAVTPFAAFFSHNPAVSGINVHLPHSAINQTNTMVATAYGAQDQDAGLNLLVGGAGNGRFTSCMAFWNRTLSSDERVAAYNVVKAWMGELGITIL